MNVTPKVPLKKRQTPSAARKWPAAAAFGACGAEADFDWLLDQWRCGPTRPCVICGKLAAFVPWTLGIECCTCGS